MSTTKPINPNMSYTTPGKTLAKADSIINAITNLNSASSTYGITAAGTTQATATQLGSVLNQVDTVAAGTGVNLPLSTGKHNSPYQFCCVINNGANTLTTYGAQGSADTVNGVAGATGVSLIAGSTALFASAKGGAWFAAIPGGNESFGAITATSFNGNTLATGVGNVAATTGSDLFLVDVKKSSATVNPATTGLIDVTGLTGQTLTAAGTYRFRCVLPGLADGTSGQKYAFTYTTATLTSIEATGIGYTASAVAVQHTTTTTNSTLLFDQAAAVIMVILEGTMVVNAGGTVSLQTGTHTGTTAGATYVGATMQFVRIA